MLTRLLKSPFTLCFLLGGFMTLALPPFHITPLYWFSFPAFILLLNRATTKRGAFFMGYLFGLGYFVFGLYWISVALTTDIKSFWWMIPFALFGLPAYFTIYWGAGALIAKYATDLLFKNPDRRLIALTLITPILLFIAELARGYFLTGFPWNPIGSGWTGWLPILQIVSVIGIKGLSFLTIFVATLPAFFWAMTRRNAGIINAAGILIFAAIFVWGAARLGQHPTAYVPDTKVRLVQPNVAQGEKWEDATRARNFNNLLRLSIDRRDPDVKAIIWPETAVPFIISENAIVRNTIQEVVPRGGLVMTGSLRRTVDGNNQMQLHNSMEAIDDHGAIIGSYDKSHLVPFGEYMPLRNVLPLPAVAAKFTDLIEGNGPSTTQWGNLPKVSALICYEVIFSGKVMDRDNRPEWIVNITNDGWYGNTTGPHQHLAAAIARAVEEGVPIVRVANTGISAVIDPMGRIVAQTKLGEQTYLDSRLPQPLNQ